jgi:starch synthase
MDPWSGHGYWDEFERALTFQIAALEWIRGFHQKPDIIHCHDHHTGLVPFMLQQCLRFESMKNIPTIITVHNAEYHGATDMGKAVMIPPFVPQNYGLLEWSGRLNPLASALKCSWQISTVSKSYMDELGLQSNGLEALFNQEKDKSRGIVNGIDTEVWDPAKDPLLDIKYTTRTVKSGKKKNKAKLCGQFNLNPDFPTIAFIGRLVREKGADLLPDLIKNYMYANQKVNFILLGTGDPALHEIFTQMEDHHFGYFDATLEYNEKLAHEIYAGSDYILMPSRVEPCGLNQMYAMRYGTIPIVRAVGGLKDTVPDIEQGDGYGIQFSEFNLREAERAIERAIQLYYTPKAYEAVLKRIVKVDYSWSNSAKQYISMYNELIN